MVNLLYYSFPTSSGGGGGVTQVKVTTDTVLAYTSGQYRILCDTTLVAIQITLPAAIEGLDIQIVNTGTKAVTIVPDGTDTFNEGSGNQTLAASPEAMNLFGDTGNWVVALALLP